MQFPICTAKLGASATHQGVLPMLEPEAQKRITGAPHGFERACYAVKAHGDGTGTIVLDWYEMSAGRDFMVSQDFMRTEIETARQIVRLLN